MFMGGGGATGGARITTSTLYWCWYNEYVTCLPNIGVKPVTLPVASTFFVPRVSSFDVTAESMMGVQVGFHGCGVMAESNTH